LKKDDKCTESAILFPKIYGTKKNPNYLKALFSHLKSKLKAIRSKPLKEKRIFKNTGKILSWYPNAVSAGFFGVIQRIIRCFQKL